MTLLLKLPVGETESTAFLAAEDRADLGRMAAVYRVEGLSFRLDQAFFDDTALCVPVENAPGYTVDELKEFFAP